MEKEYLCRGGIRAKVTDTKEESELLRDHRIKDILDVSLVF